jgi:hypothetical protein
MEDFDYVGLRDGEKMDSADYSLLNYQLMLESMDYWRLCDELTIMQAAMLVVGEDPSTSNAYVENWDVHKRPIGYEAAKTAISHGLRNSGIIGNIIPHYDTDINGTACGEIPGTIDVQASTVDVDSLRNWLRGRGFRSGFFFPIDTSNPDYLNPTDPRYAPKLAAAVRVWQAVTDPNGKHPKQALTKWLREHAAEFGLSDDEGKPNETGIEEVAKVATRRRRTKDTGPITYPLKATPILCFMLDVVFNLPTH